jgi:hypothetical protein
MAEQPKRRGPLQVRLSDEDLARARALAASQKRSLSSLIVWLLFQEEQRQTSHYHNPSATMGFSKQLEQVDGRQTTGTPSGPPG